MSRVSPSHGGVDPSAPGTVIRSALVFESIFTVGIGVYQTFFPRHSLATLTKVSASQVTETTLQVYQQYGGLAILLGALAGVCASNDKGSIEFRPTLYRAYLAYELFVVPFVLWQAKTTKEGIPKASLVITALQFVPFIAWRVFVFTFKPEWFGRWLEGKKAN